MAELTREKKPRIYKTWTLKNKIREGGMVQQVKHGKIYIWMKSKIGNKK